MWWLSVWKNWNTEQLNSYWRSTGRCVPVLFFLMNISLSAFALILSTTSVTVVKDCRIKKYFWWAYVFPQEVDLLQHSFLAFRCVDRHTCTTYSARILTSALRAPQTPITKPMCALYFRSKLCPNSSQGSMQPKLRFQLQQSMPTLLNYTPRSLDNRILKILKQVSILRSKTIFRIFPTVTGTYKYLEILSASHVQP